MLKNVLLSLVLCFVGMMSTTQVAMSTDWPEDTPSNIIALRDAVLSMKAQADFFKAEYADTRTLLDMTVNGSPYSYGTYNWRVHGDLYYILGMAQEYFPTWGDYAAANTEIGEIMDLSANAGFEASDGYDKWISGINNLVAALGTANTSFGGSPDWASVEALLLAALQDFTDARTKYTLANTLAENARSRAHDLRYSMLGMVP